MNGNKTAKGRRVLMLVENLSFPWDRRMRHLANALRRAGYSVSVICPKGEGQDRAAFEVIDGVKVYRYPTRYAASAIGYLWEYPWAFFCTAVLSLLVWIRDGIDIIHSANPPDFFFLLALPFKLLGKKYVFDEHDVSPELYEAKFQRRDLPYRLLLLLQKASYRTADLVLSTNESYRDIARERGRLSAAKLAVVRNGVDLEYFSRKEPRPELKEGFAYLAVYLGVMGSQDGVDSVIRAAHHLVHTHGRKDVLTVLIGKGECWAGLQQLTRELQLESFVKFTGRIPDALLLDYLSTADVCLAPDPPSAMNQMSTMIKILEYMACKCPIVSFDLLESRRSAAEAAHYVEHNDPGMFATAIHDLLNDPARRKRMGQVGLDRSTHLIGWSRSRESLLEAYSRLEEAHPRQRQEETLADTVEVR